MAKDKKKELAKTETKKKAENEKFNKILERVKGISENEEEVEESALGAFVEAGLGSSAGIRAEDITLSSGLSLPEIAERARDNLESSLAGVRTEKEDTEDQTKVYEENLYKPVEGLYSDKEEQEELRRRPEMRVHARMINSTAFEDVRMPSVEQNLQRVRMMRTNEMSGFQSASEEQLGKYEVGKRPDFNSNPLDSTADDRLKRVKKYEGRV